MQPKNLSSRSFVRPKEEEQIRKENDFFEKENIWSRKENRKEKERDRIWGRDFLSEKETEKGGKYV